jgi:hypothetical protein
MSSRLCFEMWKRSSIGDALGSTINHAGAPLIPSLKARRPPGAHAEVSFAAESIFTRSSTARGAAGGADAPSSLLAPQEPAGHA